MPVPLSPHSCDHTCRDVTAEDRRDTAEASPPLQVLRTKGELLGLRCEVLDVTGQSQEKERRSGTSHLSLQLRDQRDLWVQRAVTDPPVALRSRLHTQPVLWGGPGAQEDGRSWARTLPLRAGWAPLTWPLPRQPVSSCLLSQSRRHTHPRAPMGKGLHSSFTEEQARCPAQAEGRATARPAPENTSEPTAPPHGDKPGHTCEPLPSRTTDAETAPTAGWQAPAGAAGGRVQLEGSPASLGATCPEWIPLSQQICLNNTGFSDCNPLNETGVRVF